MARNVISHLDPTGGSLNYTRPKPFQLIESDECSKCTNLLVGLVVSSKDKQTPSFPIILRCSYFSHGSLWQRSSHKLQ